MSKKLPSLFIGTRGTAESGSIFKEQGVFFYVSKEHQ